MTTTTILIPVYNGAATIGPLVERLVAILGTPNLQIVLVNDGSTDASDRVCRALHVAYPGVVTYVRLARNFGEHNAVMAGLRQARGDYVVIMDDDFQNPPEEVPRLIDHARTRDLDVVYTRYARKRHSWFRNLGSRFNDLVASWLLDKPRGLYLSSFKCLNRVLVAEVIRYEGPYPYLDGLVLRSTRSIGVVEVRHEARRHGRSNYTLGKLVRLWLQMAVNFSILPLRISMVLGMAFSVLGLLLGGAVVVERLTRPELPIGWSSLLVSVVIFAGVQLMILGMLGEYVGRLFLMSNQTPQYVIREVLAGEEPPWTPPRTTPVLLASGS